MGRSTFLLVTHMRLDPIEISPSTNKIHYNGLPLYIVHIILGWPGFTTSSYLITEKKTPIYLNTIKKCQVVTCPT